jgi:hypothetical protein
MIVPRRAFSVPVFEIIVMVVAMGVMMGMGRGCNEGIAHREGEEVALGP